jgi:hypothetical protein
MRSGTSEEQEDDLLNGRRGAFASEAEREAAWKANRERLMGAVNSGTRPCGWWDYEAAVPRDPHRSQDEQLYVLGALTAAERTTFEAWCRRTHRDVSTLPRPGFRAPDPRTLLGPRRKPTTPRWPRC